MSDRPPPPWTAVIAIAAILLLIVVFTGPTAGLLIDRGWSESVARIAVAVAGGLLLLLAFLVIAVASGRVRISRDLLRGAAFLFATLVFVFVVQRWLATLFERLGVPAELQVHGAWLAAIVIVGWPAELLRKRLHISFPAQR